MPVSAADTKVTMNLSSGREETSISTALRLLAAEPRRYAVAYLSDAPDGVASLSELADYVALHADDVVDSREAATALHHVDVPKLEAAGVVEYDTRSRTVRYYPDSGLETVLEHLREQREE